MSDYSSLPPWSPSGSVIIIFFLDYAVTLSLDSLFTLLAPSPHLPPPPPPREGILLKSESDHNCLLRTLHGVHLTGSKSQVLNWPPRSQIIWPLSVFSDIISSHSFLSHCVPATLASLLFHTHSRDIPPQAPCTCYFLCLECSFPR